VRNDPFQATRVFAPEQWNADPYAKTCEQCDTVIGRFGVLIDENGLRHVTWWPHKSWSGQEGSYRCVRHAIVVDEWFRLVDWR
jgi:hypothetical protein